MCGWHRLGGKEGKEGLGAKSYSWAPVRDGERAEPSECGRKQKELRDRLENPIKSLARVA